MKNKKLRFFTVLLLYLGLHGVQAQTTLVVKEKTNTESSFTLTKLQKLTYLNGKLIINKVDGGSTVFDCVNLRRVSFNEVLTSSLATSEQTAKTILVLPTEQFINKTSIYPNPVKEQLNLKIESSFNENVEIEIINMQGNIWLKQLLLSQKNIDVSELKAGLYLCRVKHSGIIENIKFIKQ